MLCKCECRYLLGVDPGLATGVCLIDLEDVENPKKLWSAELTLSEFYDTIWNSISDGVHVVIEDFKITTETGKLTEAPWSLNLIGIVQYVAYHRKRTVDFQLPSQKPFATNERLRAVDFWHVGGEGHANDALRHSMIWIVNHNRKWTKKLLL